jgi:hypothetical protein
MLSSTEISRAIKEGEILISIDAGQAHPVHLYARVDSGASMSSIDYRMVSLIQEGSADSIIYIDKTKIIKSSLGKEERSVVVTTFTWGDSEFVLEMNSADRSKVSCPVLLGRDWLGTD